MRPEERDPAYLWDMFEAARAIIDFIGDRSREEFVARGKEAQILRLAVERELEILGEAGRRVSPGFRERHPEVPWKEIVGLRNIISHQYEKVNYAEIYAIVCRHIPDLISILEPLVPNPPEVED